MSSAAEVPASEVKAETCEVKPAVNVEAKEAVVEEEEPEEKLPPLSAQQFREFNRMADHMDYFHNHFRQIWTMMYTACENKKRPAGMSIRRFLDEGLHFISMLTTHHSIEEAHVFPMLAKRMPEFQQPDKRGKLTGPKTKGSAKAAELVKQHRDIHKGMDAFEDYLRRCRNAETELEMSVLKAQMDTWGTVLWQHLNEEVAALGAENMRKYWTIEEVRRMRM